MGLKFLISKLEDVEEAYRPLYAQQGDKYMLNVEGAVSKDKLDEFRNNNISLSQQLEKFKDVDPTKYRELLTIQQKVQEKQLIDAGKVDEVVDLRVRTMKESFDTEKTKLSTELTKTKSQLETLLVDNVVKSAAIKLGVHPDAVDDVVLRAKGVFTVENGVPTPKVDGKVIYGKDGTSPMSVDEWTAQLKTTARHLFQGSTGSGAGGGNNLGKVDMSKLTPVQKINIGLASLTTESKP